MGRVKQLWADENERIIESYLDGNMEEGELRTSLKTQGLDKDEIDGVVEAKETCPIGGWCNKCQREHIDPSDIGAI